MLLVTLCSAALALLLGVGGRGGRRRGSNCQRRPRGCCCFWRPCSGLASVGWAGARAGPRRRRAPCLPPFPSLNCKVAARCRLGRAATSQFREGKEEGGAPARTRRPPNPRKRPPSPKLPCHAGPPRFGEEVSSHDSLPEWSKGVDSSSTSASCVGSNPTAVNDMSRSGPESL